jgi:hypothetical protein
MAPNGVALVDRRPREARPRTDGAIVALHWACAAGLLLSVLTGLRIAADAPDAGALARWLGGVGPQGAVFALHHLAGLAVAAASAGYAAYLARGGLARRLFPSRDKARAMLGRGGRTAWRARNLLVYQLLFALVGLLAATGTALHLDLAPGGAAPALLELHLLAAYALVAATLLHVAAQYAFGAAVPRPPVARARQGLLWLLKMLRPTFARGGATLQVHPAAAAAAVGAAVAVGGGALVADRSTLPTLEIGRVPGEAAPRLDGAGDDPAWAAAGRVRVHTRGGANLPGGASTVEIQAVAAGGAVFLKLVWDDPTRSLKHLPLVKRPDGWRLLHEGYDLEDEDLYYEDKLAVLLSRSPETGGGGTTHLGPKPLLDLPGGLSGRGLHYTTDGSVADMWQWKAVRSGPAGHADDGAFGPPIPPKPEELAGARRYKGGYVTDPGRATYANNFGHEGPGGYGGPLTPVRLPADPGALRGRLGPVDLNPAVSDEAPWLLIEADSVPYSPGADAAIPEGTVIPGVVVGTAGAAAWEGDRADVRSGAAWADGRWTLEVARALDTGSPLDLPLVAGEPLYLWVGVFDHTQTRHSRHMRPVRLVLAPVPQG